MASLSGTQPSGPKVAVGVGDMVGGFDGVADGVDVVFVLGILPFSAQADPSTRQGTKSMAVKIPLTFIVAGYLSRY